MAELIDKSVIESQIVVKQKLDIDIKQAPKVKHQKDESVRLKITLSKFQWQKLEKMRELLSNSVPSGTWDQVLEYVSDKVIQQKDKSRLINRDQCCKICGSKWRLNIVHIKPVWAGGNSDLSNLRVLCGQHNRDLYRRQSNTRLS